MRVGFPWVSGGQERPTTRNMAGLCGGYCLRAVGAERAAGELVHEDSPPVDEASHSLVRVVDALLPA
jgi:hypothetical protein